MYPSIIYANIVSDIDLSLFRRQYIFWIIADKSFIVDFGMNIMEFESK